MNANQYFAKYPGITRGEKHQISYLLQKVGNVHIHLMEAENGGMGPAQFIEYLKGQTVGMGDIMVRPDPQPKKADPVLRAEPLPRQAEPQVIDAKAVNEEPRVIAPDFTPEPAPDIPSAHPKRRGLKIGLPKVSLPKLGNPFAHFRKERSEGASSHDEEPKEPRESIFARAFKSKWVKVTGAVIAVIVLLMVVIAVVGVPSGDGASLPSLDPTQQFTPPELPKSFLPVDLANASWFSPTQVIIVLIFLMLGFANYRDAKQRGQISDFYATIIGFVLIVSSGFVSSLLKGPLAWLQLNDFQLVYFTSALMVAISFVLVWEVSRQGGVDYSPLGDYVTSIAGWALLVGSLGAIGVVLNTPKAPVLPFSQVSTLFVLKQYPLIWMSLTVYVLLVLGAFIYGSEILRMSRTLNAKEMTGTILTSFVGLLAYPSIRIFMGWEPIQAFLAAIALASLTGLVAVRAGAVSPLTTGETRTSNAVTLPWDKLAFQLTVGLLLITLIGKV